MRKLVFLIALVTATLLGAARAATAGGWAVVTLDPMSAPPTAGTPVAVGFTILQHGMTPYSTTRASVIITGPTGETVQFDARPSGDTGHHVAAVTFPASGVWNWKIQPDWFPVQELGQITVEGAPLAGGASSADAAPEAVTTTREVRAPWSSAIRATLGVALALMLVVAAAEWRSGRRRVAT
jgi:hypothetical protein